MYCPLVEGRDRGTEEKREDVTEEDMASKTRALGVYCLAAGMDFMTSSRGSIHQIAGVLCAGD
jgi:hypothetical protein